MHPSEFGIGQILGIAGMAMLIGRSYTGWRAYRHRKAREKVQADAEALRQSRPTAG
jgi:hypothetical protein